MLKLCCASPRKKGATKLTKLPADEPSQSSRSRRQSVNAVPLVADLYRKEGRYYHRNTFTLTDGKVSFTDTKSGLFHESLVLATAVENEYRYEFIIRTTDKEHADWHMRAESEAVWRQWVSYVDADGAGEASEIRLRSPTFNQAKMGKSEHVLSQSI